MAPSASRWFYAMQVIVLQPGKSVKWSALNDGGDEVELLALDHFQELEQRVGLGCFRAQMDAGYEDASEVNEARRRGVHRTIDL